MKYLFIITMIVTIIFSACAGNDSTGVDTTPPSRPVMQKHLGEFGDSIRYHPYIAYDTTRYVLLNDNNSGIDAETDGNWINVKWNFMLDNDLRLYRIFRYADGNSPVKIDSISSNSEEYIDRFLPVPDQGVLEINWNYFIQAVDMAGNYSTSDTVHYLLLDKVILVQPLDNSILNTSRPTFQWMKVGTTVGTTTRLRLVLMNEEKQYLWHDDEYVLENNNFSINYYGPQLYPGTYYWRVDAIGRTETDGTINSGSESREFKFVIPVP